MPVDTAPNEAVQPCEPLPVLLDELPIGAEMSCAT